MLKQKEKIDKSTWLTTTGQRARYYNVPANAGDTSGQNGSYYAFC